MCNLWKLTTTHLQPSRGRAGGQTDLLTREEAAGARLFHATLFVVAAVKRMGGYRMTHHLSLSLLV